ncbi:MAG: hypothetical protein K0R12_857 [Gammaproteobacteria bacterium]|nr:hypothetical protein [Gammaproteobacteria bacterium]
MLPFPNNREAGVRDPFFPLLNLFMQRGDSVTDIKMFLFMTLWHSVKASTV